MGVRLFLGGLRHTASASQKPQQEEPGEGGQAAALGRARAACTARVGISRGVAATLVAAAVEAPGAITTITTVVAPVIPGVTATVVAALGHT